MARTGFCHRHRQHEAIASYTPGSLSSDEPSRSFQNMAKIGTDGYLMDGTVALNHTQSQTDMMMNKALFIPNGNWMEAKWPMLPVLTALSLV